ncbi:MAG: YraN family protein [Sulfurovum sp.]|nr:YraN family protein [Sulfurovaceae bacterium]
MNTKEIGDIAESLAVEYLINLNYDIIEQNFYAKKIGEIDIIAKKNNTLHFIEVKSAKADFDPIYNLTPRKLRRVINSTQYYLKINNIDIAFCIDAIIIRDDEIDFIENISL